MRLFHRSTLQPIRRKITQNDFERAQKALATVGIEISPEQEITIYPSKGAYVQARYEKKKRDNAAGIVDWLFKYVGKIAPAALVDIKDNCAIHISRGNETLFFHEAVHAHDLRKKPQVIVKLIDETQSTKKERFGIHTWLEGRAKFVEKIGSTCKDFSLGQRIKLTISCHLESLVAVALTYFTADWLREIIEDNLYNHYHLTAHKVISGILTAVALGCMYICTKLIKLLTPYIAGMRFMEHVYIHFNKDAQKTFDATLEFEPTYDEILHPRKYLERISQGND